ncbi:hypothetical protein ACKWTF_009952 [Chironomus riparius]
MVSFYLDRVYMYVYEEIINGKKLTEIINETHENVKYLPGYKLPDNVFATSDIVEAAKNADILIFVLPHQYISHIGSQLAGLIKPTSMALSLTKGFEIAEDGRIELISQVIRRHLNIPCAVLMGANLATEVAGEKFCETTIGVKDSKMAPILYNLFSTPNFRVVISDDADTVEMCGALKNIVATGAGFIDGLGYGDNTKAAVIRLGLMEMIKFGNVFYPGCQLATFFESCGIADLVTTCYGGRNRKAGEVFVKQGMSFTEIEKNILNVQNLQGPETAAEVYHMLKTKDMEDQFPMFTAVHKICIGELKPDHFIECVREHPEHM